MNDLDLLYEGIGDGFISGDTLLDYTESVSEEEWKDYMNVKFNKQMYIQKIFDPLESVFGEY